MHPPTYNKLHECQNILLSDEFDWYPSRNFFETSSMEEEYRTNLNVHRYINIVDSRVPCVPPMIHCRYDSVIHEFDRAMKNVSIGLDRDLMVDILMRKVRVNRTRNGFSTYTDKRHHGISADILARKLWIGLDKSNLTLKSTTQDHMRSALKPLTRRYRTYFLSQRLRQLNCRFCVDTLFAKGKSIAGNTCAQIFTDGEFVQIIPMRSKSEAGTTLDRINRDVGAAKEIFMDNEPKQNGYNTEMQRVARLARMEVQTTDTY